MITTTEELTWQALVLAQRDVSLLALTLALGTSSLVHLERALLVDATGVTKEGGYEGRRIEVRGLDWRRRW